MCFHDPSDMWQALTGQGGQLKGKQDGAISTTSSVTPPKAPADGSASSDNSAHQPSPTSGGGGAGGIDSLMIPRTAMTPVSRDVPTG